MLMMFLLRSEVEKEWIIKAGLFFVSAGNSGWCKRCVTLLFFGMAAFGSAQNTSTSPYSSYGIGDPESFGLSHHLGMGGAKYSTILPYTLNIANPGTYGAIDMPTFDVGISSNFLKVGESNPANSTYLRSIAFGLPIARHQRTKKSWWGASFGLVPFTRMGYTISTSEDQAELVSIRRELEGEGNISRFFIGNAFNPINDSLQLLSIGFNASYLFGNLQRTQRFIPEDGSNIVSATTLSLGDVLFDFGLLYQRQFGKMKFSAGAAYAYGDHVRAVHNRFTASYTGALVTPQAITDTIVYRTDTGTVYIPQNIGGGITVEWDDRWIFAADYETRNWSDLKIMGADQGLAPASQLSVGMQYTPDRMDVNNIWKIASYRTGFRIANTRLRPAEQPLSEYGISFGMGIPILKSQSRTSLNLAVELGERGNNGEGIVKEQFTNFTVGFSFTPHKFDRWFHKRKIE